MTGPAKAELPTMSRQTSMTDDDDQSSGFQTATGDSMSWSSLPIAIASTAYTGTMNSTRSQRIPGRASAIQKAFFRVLFMIALPLDPVADHEPRLLPERVRVDRELELEQAAAEVCRRHHRRGERRRQHLLLDHHLRRHPGERVLEAVAGVVLVPVR